MATCTFFGHRDCFALERCALEQALEQLIREGVDTFYVGNQGNFDAMVYSCLKRLRQGHPHIRICVVLAYLPTGKQEGADMADTMYPGIEGHPKFAIERRNRWMIQNADTCLCYIDRPWGGAYKFARLAVRSGLQVKNLGSTELLTGGK